MADMSTATLASPTAARSRPAALTLAARRSAVVRHDDRVLTQFLEPFQYLHKLIVHAIVLSNSPYVFSALSSGSSGMATIYSAGRPQAELEAAAG